MEPRAPGPRRSRACHAEMKESETVLEDAAGTVRDEIRAVVDQLFDEHGDDIQAVDGDALAGLDAHPVAHGEGGECAGLQQDVLVEDAVPEVLVGLPLDVEPRSETFQPFRAIMIDISTNVRMDATPLIQRSRLPSSSSACCCSNCFASWGARMV